MLELLFIIGLVSWLLVSALQYVAGLPAAGTLSAAAILAPALAWIRMRSLARAARLDFVRGTRSPVPPERFYWPLVRRRLGWRTAAFTALAGISWPMALARPAQFDPATSWGWMAGAAAILATAEAAAAAWLYVKASQKFHHLKPAFLGWIRLSLYRLSDNHEFLGEEPLPLRKKEREAVY